MVLRTRCGWVKYIPIDKRVAHEKALARKKCEDCLIGESAVRLRLMEELGNARRICGLDRRFGDPIVLEMDTKNAGRGYSRDNVVLLWPNCPGTIDTWRNK